MNEIRNMLNKARGIRKMSLSAIARSTGQSPQNLNGKISRGTLSVSELIKIASVLDAELVLVDRNTGQRII